MFRMHRIAVALAALLVASPAALNAGSTATQSQQHHYPRYRLVDLGSFGGGFGFYNHPAAKVLNRWGAGVSGADTTLSDPFYPNCFYDCQVMHAFLGKNGKMTDLGALLDSVNSIAYTINDLGLVVGASQTGDIDPVTGFPKAHAVVWRNGRITDLGSLDESSQSAAYAFNDFGLISGPSLNGQTDPFANLPIANCLWAPNVGSDCSEVDFAFNALFAPAVTQTRAVLWRNGKMQDLGTLGGPDSTPVNMNERGQIIGWSYTSYAPNPSGVPDVHPFLWEVGHMTDLGTLGGTVAVADFINERGQVIGASNTAGDTELHAFLWSRDTGMRDLGTLGGTYAHPNWINDRGDVVGYSNTAQDQSGHRQGRAFFWHNGVMKNLGTLGTDDASEADSINNRCQIVGQTFVRGGEDLNGFYSDCGGPLVALDKLVGPASDIHIIGAFQINDRGVIAASGVTPDGEVHPLLLEPW